MDRRKKELEEKRQKLNELRNARNIRRSKLIDVIPSTRDIKDVVFDLVGDRAGTSDGSTSSAANGSVSSGLASKNTSADLGNPYDGGMRKASEAADWRDRSELPAPPPNLGALRNGAMELETSTPKVLLDLPPKEKVTYSKEAQTTEDFYERPDPEEVEEEIQGRIRSELAKDREIRQKALEEERRRKQAEEAQQIRDLTEDEIKELLGTEDFVDFVEYSSKIVERALNETYDILTDYTVAPDLDSEEDESRVKQICDFYDEKLLRGHRAVMDVKWSSKYPELLAAAYNKNPVGLNEPDGLVLIWNTHLLERPEFVFHAPSDVTTCMFSPFHPNLVVGGTYSGQVLIWDTRARHLPVLKTPLSAVGHTHPIYAVQMVGTQNAYNFISASTDGLVCSWQLDMLAQPQETLECVHPSHPRTEEVAITAFGFPDNETSTFWLGTEEGLIYQANRYDRAGSKAGVNQYDVYKGHHGCITGLNFHPLFGPADFSDLFLTCSVDWTIKLWRAKSGAKPSSVSSSLVMTPLYSFEIADDYVYDVCWSPSHPALFASVDGTGRFDLWNLNMDTEVPVASTVVSQRALNKCRFDRDGKKVACGGSDGHVTVYDLGELANPRMEEWTLFHKTIGEMVVASGGKDLGSWSQSVPPLATSTTTSNLTTSATTPTTANLATTTTTTTTTAAATSGSEMGSPPMVSSTL